MSNIKDGGPAFPFLEFRGAGPEYQKHTGLTLRDYFAAKSMQGLLTQAAAMGGDSPPFDLAAKLSYHYADAMLKAREAK